MADSPSPIEFEDVTLDEARRMGRGPRMELMLYDTLRQKIQSLSIEVVRIYLGQEIRPERMKNRILRIAAELGIPITIRRVPGGLIFWRSTDEDLQHAQEVVTRLQFARPAACIARHYSLAIELSEEETNRCGGMREAVTFRLLVS
jgi:hypothetical protein